MTRGFPEEDLLEHEEWRWANQHDLYPQSQHPNLDPVPYFSSVIPFHCFIYSQSLKTKNSSSAFTFLLPVQRNPPCFNCNSLMTNMDRKLNASRSCTQEAPCSCCFHSISLVSLSGAFTRVRHHSFFQCFLFSGLQDICSSVYSPNLLSAAWPLSSDTSTLSNGKCHYFMVCPGPSLLPSVCAISFIPMVEHTTLNPYI